MTRLVLALYVTCLLLGRITDVAALQPSSQFLSVNVGEDVILKCFNTDAVGVMFYWYKQTLGKSPKLMSKFYKHDKNGTFNSELQKDPRFELETTAGKNHLKISNVQISDSATYHCIRAFSFMYEFLESITVSVKGSGWNTPALVQQSASETIQPGGSVTLNCTVSPGTCDSENSVYWFKNSEKSEPRLIYTYGNRTDQCKRTPEIQTNTCVYNLPMENLNLSHAGTYYCAVASCGHILFGKGTKLTVTLDEVDSLFLVSLLSGAVAFTTILVVFLAYTNYRLYKMNSCKCTDSQGQSAAASALNECHEDPDSLHYAALRGHKVGASRRQRDNTKSECVYSAVKH